MPPTALACHLLTLYQDDAFLATAVADFLETALGHDEGSLIIATPLHWQGIRDRLEQRGFDIEGIVDRGEVLVLDAETQLRDILSDGAPSLASLQRSLGPHLADLRRSTGRVRVRAFGEMVNLLWQGGQAGTAMQLEQAWHELLMREPATLLCAYASDPLGHTEDPEALLGLCMTHGHVHASEQADRHSTALQTAMAEVLGPAQVGRLQVVLSAEGVPDGPGTADLTILWLRTYMPRMAERVLVRVQGLLAGPAERLSA